MGEGKYNNCGSFHLIFMHPLITFSFFNFCCFLWEIPQSATSTSKFKMLKKASGEKRESLSSTVQKACYYLSGRTSEFKMSLDFFSFS